MAGDIESLQCYLVGGAVRDELLGRPVGDRDWVVVASSPEQMVKLGFTQVGRDFPVFLHPVSHEEYALARTERKQGHGHRGFTINADPGVTLEEDLLRRDLTINAIARSARGELIDPHGGVADIEARQLRHVSPAFAEDPLRVFRVARFAAQLPGFVVAPETNDLMRRVCTSGELQHLSAERVWQEFHKALGAALPQRFFEVLGECGGLQEWFGELVDLDVRFSGDDAKGSFSGLPLDEAGFRSLAGRLKAPNAYLQAALDRLQYGQTISVWQECSPGELIDALVALKAFHDTARVNALVKSLMAQGVDGQWEALHKLVAQLKNVRPADESLRGAAFGAALRDARIALVEAQRRL